MFDPSSHRRFTLTLVPALLLAVSIWAPSAIAQTRSAGGGGGARPGMMVERLRNVLREIDLNDDQRQKVNALLDATTAKVREAIASADAADNGGRRTKVQEALQDLRQQLMQILTPQQQQSLREKMQEEGVGGGALRKRLGNDGAPAGNKAAAADNPTTRPADPTNVPKMTDTMMEGATKTDGVKKGPTIAPQDTGPAKPIEAGEVAPDFKLKKLDGSTVQLSAMKGRVVVLVFGSYTDPVFRGRAPALEKLYQDLGTRASMFLVYTRELHPVGGWELEKNKDANIFVNQPLDVAGRIAAARKYRDTLHLTMPTLVDEMDDAWTKAYGGFPDGAIVINREGTVAASQQWMEPAALRRAIEKAISPERGSTTRPLDGSSSER